jgi:predicted ester cyclase
MSFWRFDEEGKVAESWGMKDAGAIAAQLGS